MTEKQYDDAESWALAVRHDQPHSLEELQHRLQVSAPSVIERAAQPRTKTLLNGLYLLLSAFSLIGPIAAVTVFFDMSEAFTRSYDFDAGFEFTVALIGFLFGLFFQGRMLYRWWNEGRYRDNAAIVLSTLILFCAAGTILQAYPASEYSGIVETLFLIPAFITGAGSIATIWLSAVAPPSPKGSESYDSQVSDTVGRDLQDDVELDKLTGEAHAAVLKDRNNALDALYIRGFLEGYDVRELRSRSLGRLTEKGRGSI